MSEYGYIPEAPEQSAFNNKGIFNPKDIYNLNRADKWTPELGQLELIQTQTIDDTDFSESILAMDFTSLKNYNVHFLTYSNFSTQGYGYPSIRLSNNGGTSFHSSTYQYVYWNTAENTVNEGKSNSADTIRLGANQYKNMNGYVYFYNLLDSTKYSFTTSQSSNVGGNNVSKDVSFGSGVYQSAEENNAIRFRMNNANYIGTLTASLYGIKDYS